MKHQWQTASDMAERLGVARSTLTRAFERTAGRPAEVAGELVERREAHKKARASHYYRVSRGRPRRRGVPCALEVGDHIVVFDADFCAVEWIWLRKLTREDAWSQAEALVASMMPREAA